MITDALETNAYSYFPSDEYHRGLAYCGSIVGYFMQNGARRRKRKYEKVIAWPKRCPKGSKSEVDGHPFVDSFPECFVGVDVSFEAITSPVTQGLDLVWRGPSFRRESCSPSSEGMDGKLVC